MKRQDWIINLPSSNRLCGTRIRLRLGTSVDSERPFPPSFQNMAIYVLYNSRNCVTFQYFNKNKQLLTTGISKGFSEQWNFVIFNYNLEPRLIGFMQQGERAHRRALGPQCRYGRSRFDGSWDLNLDSGINRISWKRQVAPKQSATWPLPDLLQVLLIRLWPFSLLLFHQQMTLHSPDPALSLQ